METRRIARIVKISGILTMLLCGVIPALVVELLGPETILRPGDYRLQPDGSYSYTNPLAILFRCVAVFFVGFFIYRTGHTLQRLPTSHRVTFTSRANFFRGSQEQKLSRKQRISLCWFYFLWLCINLLWLVASIQVSSKSTVGIGVYIQVLIAVLLFCVSVHFLTRNLKELSNAKDAGYPIN